MITRWRFFLGIAAQYRTILGCQRVSSRDDHYELQKWVSDSGIPHVTAIPLEWCFVAMPRQSPPMPQGETLAIYKKSLTRSLGRTPRSLHSMRVDKYIYPILY